MIYSQQRFHVCCDKCGKTIETNAADEIIASETAKRQGWFCNTILRFSGVYKNPKYVNLCPKCKEEQMDKKLQETSNDRLKQEAEFYWKKQGGGSHAQWDKYVKVVRYFTEWQKNQIRFYIEGELSVCENEDRKDFGKMVLDYINTL